jgi:molybdopterin molybdotransferase
MTKAKNKKNDTLSIDDFSTTLKSKLNVLTREMVNSTDALGRVLAADVRARCTSPKHDLAAIDGYAAMRADVQSLPCSLLLVGESKANSNYRQEIEPGQIIRVFAGAGLPVGTDMIIPPDNTSVDGCHVIINEIAHNDEFICHTGIDFANEDVVLKEGSVVTARDIGLSGAMKISWLPVTRKPRIGVLAIGDELAMLGDFHDETARTISSSSLVMCAFIKACGAIPVNLGIMSDSSVSPDLLEEYTKDLDMLITTGGLSTASNNLLCDTINEMNSHVAETQIALNTTERVLLAEIDNTITLCLPGNPISAQICAALFVRSASERMINLKESFYKKSSSVLGRDLDVNDVKMDYIFSKLWVDENHRLTAHPASSYDRLLMSSLADSDCIIRVDKDKTKRGDIVEITRFTCSVISG